MKRAMSLARGDYVLFTAADDELRPRFSSTRHGCRATPQAGFCSGICEWRCTRTAILLNGGRMPNEACYLSPAEMVKLSQRSRLAINNQAPFTRNRPC
jgi:hypothetical protein